MKQHQEGLLLVATLQWPGIPIKEHVFILQQQQNISGDKLTWHFLFDLHISTVVITPLVVCIPAFVCSSDAVRLPVSSGRNNTIPVHALHTLPTHRLEDPVFKLRL